MSTIEVIEILTYPKACYDMKYQKIGKKWQCPLRTSDTSAGPNKREAKLDR